MIWLAFAMGLPFLLFDGAIIIHYARLAYRRRNQASRPCFGMYDVGGVGVSSEVMQDLQRQNAERYPHIGYAPSKPWPAPKSLPKTRDDILRDQLALAKTFRDTEVKR